MSRTFDNEEDKISAKRQYWMDIDEDWYGYASSKKYREDPFEKQAVEFGKTIAAGGSIKPEDIQRISSAGPKVPAGIDASMQGPGMPLEGNLLSEMEDLFDTDLGQVRIHTSGGAQQMNKKAGANAITRNQDIYFNRNKYNPDSIQGKELLAHEITHTLQQRNNPGFVQCSPADVDQAVERIKQILGRRAFKRIRPEKAVAAYREIQKLSGPDIQDFYTRYSALAANIDWNLPGEFRASAGFGFQQGIAEDEKGKLKTMLSDPATWIDQDLLRLTMQMVQSAFSSVDESEGLERAVVRLDPDIVSLVLGKLDQSNADTLSAFGFANGAYTPLKYMPAKLTRMRGYGGMGIKYFNTEKKKARNVIASLGIPILNLLGNKNKPKIEDFSLAQFEDAMGGTSMGVDFIAEKDENGDFKEDSKDGKLSFNADFKKGEAHMDAASLPFASINYQGSDYTFTSKQGTFEGVVLNMNWNTNQEIPKAGELNLTMDKFEINDLRMVMEEETYGIGHLSLSGIRVKLIQNMGQAEQLSDTLSLMSRITTDLIDVSSLITYGITQTLYRFTTPATQTEYDNRKKDQQGLATIMKTQFTEGMSFELYFTDLLVKNFVYIDKDNVTDSFGESLSTEAPAIETMSFIQVSDNGKESSIKLNTIGVPIENKQRLYDLKVQLSTANTELAELNTKYQKRVYKGKKKKDDADLQKEIADKKQEITNLQVQIQQLQPDMAFDFTADIYGLDMSQGKLFNKIGSGLVSDYANEVSGFENTKIKHLTFNTKFNQQGITETSLDISELIIPELTLGGIHYSASDNSMNVTAQSAVLTNIKASLEIDFTNQDETRYQAELLKLEDELYRVTGELEAESTPDLGNKNIDQNKIDSLTARALQLDREIFDFKANFEPGATEFRIGQELQQLKYERKEIQSQLNGAYGDLDALMQPSLANKGNQQQEEMRINEKIAQLQGELANKDAAIASKQEELAPYNPVQQVLVKRLDITKTTCSGLQLLLPLKKMAFSFAKDHPVELENIFLENLLVKNENGEWKVGAGEAGDKMKTGFSKMTIPAGLVINQQDDQLKDVFRVNMSTVVAEGMSVDLLKDGTVEYELKTLIGSGVYDNMQVDEKNPDDMSKRLTAFVLPGSTQDGQSFIKGSYKDNVLKNKIYIPEIDVPFLNIHAENASVVVPPGGLPTILEGIYVDCEVVFNSNKTAPNPVLSFTITAFKIDTVTSNGMVMDFGDIHVDIPTEVSSVINGLYLNNLRLVSSVEETTNENGEKQVDVKWNREPAKDAQNNPLDMTSGLSSMMLPAGFDVTVGKTLGIEISKMSSGALSFTLLSAGGMSYTSENLDVAGKFWQKNKKGETVRKGNLDLDSNKISGSYSETTIGSGIDAHLVRTIMTEVDIPSLDFNRLYLKSEETTINVNSSNTSYIKNMAGKVTVVITEPSEREIADAKAKSKKFNKENKAEDFITETGKDQANDKEHYKALSKIDVNVESLKMEQLKTYGLDYHSKKATAVKTSEFKEAETIKVTDFKLLEDQSATLNHLVMTGFNIHVPAGDESMSFDGHLSLGGQKDKTGKVIPGIDIGAAEFTNDIIKKTMLRIPLIDGDPMDFDYSKEHSNFKGSAKFSVDQISFDGDSEGEYTIIVTKPTLDWIRRIPNISPDKTGFNQEQAFVFDSDKSKINIGIPEMSMALKPIFQADKITIKQVPMKDQNGNEMKDEQGETIYGKEFIVENPVMDRFGISGEALKGESGKGTVYISEIILSGTLQGQLVVRETMADLSKEDFKESYQRVWEIDAAKSELKMEGGGLYANLDEVMDNLKKHEDETTGTDQAQPAKEKDEDDPWGDEKFAFLDSAQGNVSLTMFGIKHTAPIESPYPGTFADGHINIKSMVEFIARRFNQEMSGISFAALVIDELTCEEHDGQYWITSSVWTQTQYLKILLNHTNNLALVHNGNKEYVRLACLVNSLMNPVSVPEGDPGDFKKWLKGNITESSEDYIEDWLNRVGSPMNPKLEIDASIDMNTIPGMTGQRVNFKMNAGMDQSFINPGEPGYSGTKKTTDDDEKRRLTPFMDINNLKIPPFSYKFGERADLTKSSGVKTANGIISTNGIDIESINFDYNRHISPITYLADRLKDYDHLEMKNITIKGLNIKLSQ